MVLPRVRDHRTVTVRRGGTLSDEHHRLLAPWAAERAEHVLDRFEHEQPHDPRPREATAAARAWARGEVPMVRARAAGGRAVGAARGAGPSVGRITG